MANKRNRERFNDWLSRLEPTKFEAMLAEYFRDQGYRVEHVGAAAQGRRFDGGIDLKLYKDTKYSIVQCKNWNAMQVTHNAVHELFGVMLTQRATNAIVVTSGEFTAHAITSAAQDRRMRLIDGMELRRMLATWPGRTRWARSRETVFSRLGFTGASWGKRLKYGVAVAVIAIVLVATFAGRDYDSRKPAGVAAVPIAASTYEPVSAVDQDYALSEPRRIHENPSPSILPSDSQTQISRSASSHADRRRAERSGMHSFGGSAHDVASSALGIPDANRTIDPESARIVVRRIPGVRSAVWMDQTNFIVRVDKAERRSMAMIDEICDALEPLGDTLGVVVALQNANARNGDEMQTLTRNCQLVEGQRAFGQRKRQIDTVSPEVRAQFKAMQDRNQPKR